MSAKVSATPQISRPGIGARQFDIDLVRSVFNELLYHARRLNAAVTVDGVDAMTAPLPLMSYTVAGVPTASLWEGAIIYVSNETGGKTIAFSDGTNWRRVQDRTIIA